ncbi:unnamed protein product [Owenia fusiformis]|uniref:SOCS box domain-containing protein n=1 Tax=Owenia fusiformis TaxID=6347 RepID=A0A8S4MZL0_OWEFU|nr:unnamed protein product [Owenia fusiformis]
MGVNASLLMQDLRKYNGKRCMPSKKLVTFPESRLKTAGSIVTCFSAMPYVSGISVPSAEDKRWIVDTHFMPYDDTQLISSVGVFRFRQGMTPVNIQHMINGLLIQWNITDDLKFTPVRGTSSTSYPQISLHPNGKHIGYINSNVTIINPSSKHKLHRRMDIKHLNFRNMSISPNGFYIASIARSSYYFELVVSLVDPSSLVDRDPYSTMGYLGSSMSDIASVNLHRICPGFMGTRLYTEKAEVVWSPDSQYIAVTSSMGMLLIVKRSVNNDVTKIIPGILDYNCQKLANERTGDFDPRFGHQTFTFALRDDTICTYDLDTDDFTEVLTVECIETLESVTNLKYNVAGTVLAIGTSEMLIHIHDSDTFQLLYSLDGKSQGSMSVQRHPDNNEYPSLLRMSFSHTGNQLCTSNTDGIVRIWQLKPYINLQHMCRTAIQKHVRADRLVQLPLPPKLIFFILQWPLP